MTLSQHKSADLAAGSPNEIGGGGGTQSRKGYLLWPEAVANIAKKEGLPSHYECPLGAVKDFTSNNKYMHSHFL